MNNLELLDQYIDNQLPLNQSVQLEEKLQIDADLQQLLDSVMIARQTIRFSAITKKVKGLHELYIDEIREETKPGKILPMPVSRNYSWAARIAAGTLIGLLSYGGYQYMAINPNQVYNDKFISYQLPATRGAAAPVTRLNSFYSAGNYAAVTKQFNALPVKKPTDFFLTGIAYLKQHNYEQAIATFTTLRQLNKQSTQAYFDQETDYYLALAYLGANKIDNAYSLFTSIHNKPHHLFRESISEADLLKMNLLRLKM